MPSHSRDLAALLNFDWLQTAPPQPLSAWALAPRFAGIYELGFMHGDMFEAVYAGRAIGVSLRVRLAQHWKLSHNRQVRANAQRLWFRARVLQNPIIATYIEAVSSTAFDYAFNRRNEWRAHWALEA